MTRTHLDRPPRHRRAALALAFGGSLLAGVLAAPTADADTGAPAPQHLVSYNDFSSTEGLQLLGNAQQSRNRVQLTAAVGGQTGVTWANQNLDPAEDFSTSFVLDLHDANGCAADGIDFVVQGSPDGARAVGAPGGALGYAGITPSFAAEFDIFGGNGGDPNSNHVGFLTNGDPDNADYPDDWTSTLPAGPTLYGAGPVHAWLDYTASTHEARLYVSGTDTKPDDPTLDITHDISADITGHSAYVGFTAATGGCNAVQDLVSWNATGVPGAANDTLALTADPASPAPFGPTTKLTATVQRTDDDAPVPTGSVDFFRDGTQIGSGALDEDGVATFTLPKRLQKGTYTFRADYAGDGTANPLTATQDYVVGPVAPTVTITPVDDTFAYGSRVVVNVTGPPKSVPPTGKVDWYDGGQKVATSKLGGDGRAVLAPSTLQAGTHQLVATYTADNAAGSRYTDASSDPRNITVTKADGATMLTSTVNPVTQGDRASLVALVSTNSGGGPAKVTGTVTFVDLTTEKTIGTTHLNNGGRAAVPTRKLGAGEHDITATYNGDGNVAPSTSGVYHLFVNAPVS